ncbi:Hsp20/alpha crystallin family protein [Rhodocaloribacter sp.]
MTRPRLISDPNHHSYSSFGWAPRIDMAETEREYLISVDLPGVEKEGLEVTFRDHCLTVTGERLPVKRQRTEVHRGERPFGRFYRAFTVPKAVRVDRIEAFFEDGILTIKIPKLEKDAPLRIEIR